MGLPGTKYTLGGQVEPDEKALQSCSFRSTEMLMIRFICRKNELRGEWKVDLERQACDRKTQEDESLCSGPGER